jgi:hypothetical protein
MTGDDESSARRLVTRCLVAMTGSFPLHSQGRSVQHILASSGRHKAGAQIRRAAMCSIVLISRMTETAALAPRDRYQMVTKMAAKSGVPLAQGWSENLIRQEEQLWQTWPTRKFMSYDHGPGETSDGDHLSEFSGENLARMTSLTTRYLHPLEGDVRRHIPSAAKAATAVSNEATAPTTKSPTGLISYMPKTPTCSWPSPFTEFTSTTPSARTSAGAWIRSLRWRCLPLSATMDRPRPRH